MKIPKKNRFRHSREYHPAHTHDLTFRDIYEAINYRNDFNEPQLFYLGRLVDRKLKALSPELNAKDLEMKPYG